MLPATSTRCDHLTPQLRNKTFKDLEELLLTDYEIHNRSSTRRVESALVHLREAFGSVRPVSIKTTHIRRYETERIKAGAAPATVNNEKAYLRRMFNLAELPNAPKVTTSNPHNARRGFFEAKEFAAVLAELPDHWRSVMTVAYHTGWRVQSELLPLRWRQFDFRAGVIRLEPGTTKNREGRTFPFARHPELKRVFEEQRERAKVFQRERGLILEHVFFHRQGERLKDYRKAWKTACDGAAHGGVPKPRGKDLRAVTHPELVGRLVHDLRRTAVRNLERAGVPRSTAMKLTGHLTEAVYRRYAIVSEADLGEGVAKLAATAATGNGAK